jgi:predicted secreted protein
VGAAGVLAEHGVQNGLAGTGIEHVKAVTRDQNGSWAGSTVLGHLADTGVAHVSRDVALFQFAQQHVNQNAVGLLRSL